jgi:hypothetical protein
MSLNHWMSWEGGVDLVAKTAETIEMPNAIVHVARMVHTPIGSAPAGMLFWQPDPAAAPLVFGFVSSNPALGAYFAQHIFAGTPFENAPALDGTIDIEVTADRATARVVVPGFVFETVLSGFSETIMIDRTPSPMAPFRQQGLEAAAVQATLAVNGTSIPLVIPPVGITGGPGAVLSPTGIYAR